MQTFRQYLELTESATMIDGWEVIKTNHGKERSGERATVEIVDDLINKVIARMKQAFQKITKAGEYLFFSKSMNRGIVMNVEIAKPQLRVITVLPANKSVALPGTKSVMVESVTYELIEID